MPEQESIFAKIAEGKRLIDAQRRASGAGVSDARSYGFFCRTCGAEQAADLIPRGWYSVRRHLGATDGKPQRLGVYCSADCLAAQMPRLRAVEGDLGADWEEVTAPRRQAATESPRAMVELRLSDHRRRVSKLSVAEPDSVEEARQRRADLEIEIRAIESDLARQGEDWIPSQHGGQSWHQWRSRAVWKRASLEHERRYLKAWIAAQLPPPHPPRRDHISLAQRVGVPDPGDTAGLVLAAYRVMGEWIRDHPEGALSNEQAAVFGALRRGAKDLARKGDVPHEAAS